MELAEIKRQALAAREFSLAVGPDASRSVTLRVPTQHELALAARRCNAHLQNDDLAAQLVLQRVLVLGAV